MFVLLFVFVFAFVAVCVCACVFVFVFVFVVWAVCFDSVRFTQHIFLLACLCT